MGIILKDNFRSNYTKGIINKFIGEYNKVGEQFREIFNVQSSLKDSEVSSFSDNFTVIPESGEAQPVQYFGASERYKPTFTHTIFKGGFQISREAKDDGKNVSLLNKYTPQLMQAAKRTLEIRGANVLLNAFDSNYTMAGGDGAALVSTSHTSAVGNMANTQATQAAFSPTAIYDLAVIVRKFKDYNGNKALGIRPRKLVISSDLMKDAEVFLKTMALPQSANNDLNYVKSLGIFPEGYTINDYLDTTSTKYYILTDAMDGLKCFERVAPEISQDNAFETDVEKVKLYMRYSFGWEDWRGIAAGGNI